MRQFFASSVILGVLIVASVWSTGDAQRTRPKSLAPISTNVTQQDYGTYQAALASEEDNRAAEETAWLALQQADADLLAAQQARDSADQAYQAAKADTDAAHQATQAAYQAVR